MTREELREYIECGDEIEWKYQDKWYAITFARNDKNELCISFYEAYQEPIHVYTFDELINIKYNGVTVMEMLESLGDEEAAGKRGDLLIF